MDGLAARLIAEPGAPSTRARSYFFRRTSPYCNQRPTISSPFIPFAIGSADVGATEIGTTLLSIAALAVIAHQILGAVEKWLRVRGTRASVEGQDAFQTKAVCEILHKEPNDKFTELETHVDSRMKGLTEKLDGFGKSMRNEMNDLKDDINATIRDTLRSIGQLEGGTHAAGSGASGRIRTDDPLITNQELCH